MSWLDKLFRTYENNVDACSSSDSHTPVLLPICHTTQQAHIEIAIDEKGVFLHASVVAKDDATSLVPCTEKSASRSGKTPVNHPLADKLQYIAGDFADYGGEVTSGFAKSPSTPFDNFVADLTDWSNSQHAHWKMNAVLTYIKKKTVIADLIHSGVLHVAAHGPRSGKLIYEWNDAKPEKYDSLSSAEQKDIDKAMEETKPAIFSILTGKIDSKGKRAPWQADAFVRWRVEKAGVLDSSTQTDKELQQAWIDYYSASKQTTGTCLITGEESVLADSHPAKIRNAGDKAKLISSNDSSGFTYRGRFTADGQVCGVSFEKSQKAYNALRWLIARQGWRNGSQAIVSWAISGAEIPCVTDNTLALFGSESETDNTSVLDKTAQSFAINLSKQIAGYSAKLTETDEIIIMALDSATPGRMAITYYRELTGSDFLHRLESWHKYCAWHQKYSKDMQFVGAPSPNDIAKTAYGNNVDEKLKRATVSRLIPCIIDGFPIPQDLVNACIHNSIRRYAFDPWEWEKILGITCALYKHSKHEQEEYTMTLDRTRKNKDYLYGRLLAVGDCIEGLALKDANEKRPTSASRLMQRFADYPCSTWRNIELSLNPYKSRLGARMSKYEPELKEIMDLFNPDDFVEDVPLSGEFLLGFYCQKAFLTKSKGENNEPKK